MKIKTEELNRLLNIVYQGAGNNKLIPITQMIGIKVEENKLTLSSTDSFNYLYVNAKVEESTKDIDLCVNADLLSKLVSKFDCEFTTMELVDRSLEVTGNGKYKLELLLDEDGIYKFPVKEIPDNLTFQEIKTDKFIKAKKYAEKSLAQTMEEPDLIAYYINQDNVVSTDRNIMTVMEEGLSDTPLTLRSKFIDLVVGMKDTVKLTHWVNENTKEVNICINDGETTIYSKVNGIVEDYPYEAIKQLISSAEFKYNAKVNVKDLLAILDRISLFVTQYDSNTINIVLSDNKLFISSIKSTGVESLALTENSEPISWQGKIDIEFLKNQLTSFSKELISIYLGNDNCIKLVEDNITKLICLVEDVK